MSEIIKSKFNELIANGEQAKSICLKNDGNTVQCISGEEYVKWISDCVIFLEKHNNFNKTMVDRFIKASERANGNFTNNYDIMMGILKSLSEAEE